MIPMLSRRSTLLGLTTLFASARARLAVASAPTDQRFVVVILRGALDGLSAVPPYGDPALMDLRRPLVPPRVGSPDGMRDLGGFFGLHPLLEALHGMYAAGELAVLHAISGGYRERSHFFAQDMLESGADRRLTSGWLNRAVAGMPGGGKVPGGRAPTAIGTALPLLLRGSAPVENWAPSNLATPYADLYSAIMRLNASDTVTGPAIETGLSSRGFSKMALGDHDGEVSRMDFPSLARSAGTLLAAPNGPRIAALELGGWDTHAAQVNRLTAPLKQLDLGLGDLKQALGPAWRSTAVLVMTEFGRSVRINGTTGTDHGTGAAAFVLGGAVAGGRVIADWPGLGAGKLLEDRDLAPTRDLRAVAKGLVIDHLGVPASAMETVFPGSASIAPMTGLLRRTT